MNNKCQSSLIGSFFAASRELMTQASSTLDPCRPSTCFPVTTFLPYLMLLDVEPMQWITAIAQNMLCKTLASPSIRSTESLHVSLQTLFLVVVNSSEMLFIKYFKLVVVLPPVI